MSVPVLDIHEVTKSFGDRVVLDGVDLEVAEHEAVALIGASGSGKSTLLRCIDLLEEIDDGDVYLDGEVITDPSVNPVSVRRRLGFVFQAFNLFPHMTVLGNLIEGPTRVKGVAEDEAVATAEKYLDKVGLREKRDEYPARLSGGQKQRVAIARALTMEPKVLLFDEPTSALDPTLVGEVLKVMSELAHEGATMIVVTHEMAFAREAADRVYFIEGGTFVEAGPPEQVIEQPQDPRTQQFLSRLLDTV